MEILKTIDLSKTYKRGNIEVNALKEVNLTVEKGEFLAIKGPSGSGKSTLLHLLGGVDKPSSGWVFVDDIDIHSLSQNELAIFRRRRVGFIFQFFNLLPVLTVEENISLPAMLDNKKIDRIYYKELINILGLGDRLDFLPSQLSGGEQQRVAIARALVTKPSIILADEPTGNLDSQNSKEIVDLLKMSAKKYSQTMVMITHSDQVANQADRVIQIIDGKIG